MHESMKQMIQTFAKQRVLRPGEFAGQQSGGFIVYSG